MDEKRDPKDDEPVVSNRGMEIAVALFLLAVGGVIAFDSYRLGARWGDDGPQSGYFPFYIGLIICVSSAVTLWQALSGRIGAGGSPFVRRGQLKSVIAVLLPAALYVLGIQIIGIYIASAAYVAVFMAWLGKYSWLKSAIVGLATSAIVFVMFEIWFKVPLPKGALDPLAFLGY